MKERSRDPQRLRAGRFSAQHPACYAYMYCHLCWTDSHTRYPAIDCTPGSPCENRALPAQLLLGGVGLLSDLMRKLRTSCKLAAAQQSSNLSGGSAALELCFARFVGTLLLSTGPPGCSFEGAIP